ncbi:hypothetical protein L6R53_33360 [Myxococcota bacterium]|nr:hypothetical protein [Myxococcota bacterium]
MANTDLIGNAGVYWVAMELSLRGLVALPTVRNCPGADVLVLDPNTGALATLQVKTSGKRPKFWPATAPPDAWRKTSHAYVFVRRTAGGEGFEGFLVGSVEVAADVAANFEDLASRDRKPFAEFRLPKDPDAVARLREAWDRWRPPVV